MSIESCIFVEESFAFHDLFLKNFFDKIIFLMGSYNKTHAIQKIRLKLVNVSFTLNYIYIQTNIHSYMIINLLLMNRFYVL